MTDVHVYHLGRQPLEAVLPTLLQRSRERGWKALVRVTSPERLAALDDHLWTFSDESFLPHGTDLDPDPGRHPILLTQSDLNPNGAAILFLLDGAPMPEAIEAFARVALILDGRDEEAVAAARDTWRQVKARGHTTTYWQQDESGGWTQRG